MREPWRFGRARCRVIDGGPVSIGVLQYQRKTSLGLWRLISSAPDVRCTTTDFERLAEKRLHAAVQDTAHPAALPSHFTAGAYAEALNRSSAMIPSGMWQHPAAAEGQPQYQRPPSLQEILASLPAQLLDSRTPTSASSPETGAACTHSSPPC